MSSVFMPLDDDSAGGHYVTSGAVLVGLGSVALIIALVLTLFLKIEMRFIDNQGMALIGLGFIGLGVWMILHGRSYREKP